MELQPARFPKAGRVQSIRTLKSRHTASTPIGTLTAPRSRELIASASGSSSPLAGCDSMSPALESCPPLPTCPHPCYSFTLAISCEHQLLSDVNISTSLRG